MMWRRFFLTCGMLFTVLAPLAEGAARPPSSCADYPNFSTIWQALAAREPAIYETIYALIQRSGTPWTKTGTIQSVRRGRWVDVDTGSATPINCVVLPKLADENGIVSPTTIILDFVWKPKDSESRQAGMKVDFILGTDQTVALSMCANRSACSQMGIPLDGEKIDPPKRTSQDYNCNDPFWNELWPRLKESEKALGKMFSRKLAVSRPTHCIQRYSPASTSVTDPAIQVFFDYDWREWVLFTDNYYRAVDRREGLKLEATYDGDPAVEIPRVVSVESFVLCRRKKECRENGIRFGN